MPDSPASTAKFQQIIARNRAGQPVGTYAVCSAHPQVLQASIRQAVEDASLLHIESTSSQVNQFGGYTGQAPAQFAAMIHSAAKQAGLPSDRVLLGGDHLGPYPWRNQDPATALENGCELVRQCVLAGYSKIHLDASMACAGDPPALDERAVAERAAILCAAAEAAWQQLPPGSPPLLYVIGTEVPIPGGEVGPGQPPAVTPAAHLEQSLAAFEASFHKKKLSSAWERVIGLVVQPGVEFGDDLVWNYDPEKARALSSALPRRPTLVYEAHSTDYQSPGALARMVEDHFAILKVGPALTFAFREAVFALSSIERELLASRPGVRLSRVRQELDAAMLRNPLHWRSYYQGDDPALALARAFSLSDRCRYYWPEPAVQQELDLLHANLAGQDIPLGLLSQYLPQQYQAIRAGRLHLQPALLIDHHIRLILKAYAEACGNRDRGAA